MVVKTLKQRVYAGGHTEKTAALPSVMGDSALRQVILVTVWALIGILVPRANVYGGMSPFGVGVAAAVSGPGSIVVYLATMVGYLLPQGTLFPLRYMAAVAAVAGIRWSLSGWKSATRGRAFAPLLAFLATVSTGAAMSLVNGPDAYTLLIIAAEGMLAGGFAYFCGATIPLLRDGPARTTGLTAQEQASAIVVGAVVLMAISTVQFSGIAPGRVLAVIVILLMARCGREQGGCIAGVVMGVTMALGNPEQAHLAAAYAFGGLMAGIFSRFGRFATAGALVVANAIVVMSAGTSLAVIVGIYEVAAASIIFVVLPPSLDRKINRFFAHPQDIPAVEGLRRSVVMRLDFAAKAMDEVATTVDAVSKKLSGLSAPDLGSVYRGVSDDVCRSCGLRMFCWDNAFSDTMSSFNDMTPVLRRKGHVERSQVTGHLARHCGRLDDVLRYVNRGYGEYTIREGAWRRLAEIRGVVTDQFSGMSDMLSELSEDFTAVEQMEPEAAERVARVCENYGFLVQDTVCALGAGDRMTVEILASDVGVKLTDGRWHHEVCDACGREFDHPVVTRIGEYVKISLTEKPLLTVTVGTAQLNCSKEKLCGDAVETFADGNGRLVVVLSDGMGSGGRAAVDGAMAAGLTARLIQAGFGEDSVLRMVNSALMVKSGDESLATLDILSVDLFSGRMESLKAGAAASLLLSKGRVSRMERSSLPVGILRDITFERCKDTLVDGDLVLLMSDGVLSAGIGWVEEFLLHYDVQKNGVKRLAEELAALARGKQEGGHEDDISVIALQVRKNSKTDDEKLRKSA